MQSCGHLGDVFRKLAEQKESRIEEGHRLRAVQMLISMPPKYAVFAGDRVYQKVRYLGSAWEEAKLVGQRFWARGYLVSHSGASSEVMREYIRKRGRKGVTPGADLLGGRRKTGARFGNPTAALSASHPKAPGFAGGSLSQAIPGGTCDRPLTAVPC